MADGLRRFFARVVYGLGVGVLAWGAAAAVHEPVSSGFCVIVGVVLIVMGALGWEK